ncbi:hypothetical protein [Hyphomicrobium sp.]|uniref:hypothetical protein n=1 Tax=Hyphomicrobium sp. TaxID=82 RepID=UPI001D55A346|nr:hypothetical protein [Hyphomicrobium sp.]MBY0561276.1 hypothetical protein [Hyphomicrobium sp.]
MEDHFADNQDWASADVNCVGGIPHRPQLGRMADNDKHPLSASINAPSMNSVLYFSVRCLTVTPMAEPIEGYRGINRSYGRVWLIKEAVQHAVNHCGKLIGRPACAFGTPISEIENDLGAEKSMGRTVPVASSRWPRR